jgi:hypothetical protein
MTIKEGKVVDMAYDPKAVAPIQRPFGFVPQVRSLNRQ